MPTLPLPQLAYLILFVAAFASFGGTLLIVSVHDALARRSPAPQKRKQAQVTSRGPSAQAGAAT